MIDQTLPNSINLHKRQKEFVEAYSHSEAQKTLLAFPVGGGLTLTALAAAKSKLTSQAVSGVLVVTSNTARLEHWVFIGKNLSIGFNENVESSDLKNTTLFYQSFECQKMQHKFKTLINNRKYLIIFDEVDRNDTQIEKITKLSLLANKKTQFLYTTHCPYKFTDFNSEFQHIYRQDYSMLDAINTAPITKANLTLFAPSLKLLNKLSSSILTLDDLSYREFEILIAELLESDGYEVELMRGSKDGGVDVIAVKDMKEAGLYKTLWQAKKNKISNKVGIPVIRELADVRNEFGASKGVVVTTSFLTRGALERVYRDQFILGKVDRNDLNAWLNKKLYF